VPISAALRQGPHIKVAAVASRWQRVGDLIGSGFEPHTSRTRGRRLNKTKTETEHQSVAPIPAKAVRAQHSKITFV